MNSIDILVKEHDNIRRILKITRKACINIVNGEDICHQDFYDIADFIKTYADKYHHGKEESMLFKDMANELSDMIGEGPIRGMLIEHDYGRSFVISLETALKSHESGNNESKVDIIANAIGYANLLEKHTFKEDNMIYKYAVQNLKQETLNKLDKQFEEFETTDEHMKLKEKYTKLIDRLEEKYLA